MMQASSRIKDIDIAEETTLYTKNKILVSSATAMTAQANLLPQMILKLIG
jgi:flagellin